MPKVRGQVVVVGSINVDVVLRVARLPRAGETVAGGVLERHGGGKGANQAVAAARVGADVYFVGAVGEDDFGAQALAELRAEQIDVSGVVRAHGAATGLAAIMVDERGENQIAVASGANAELDQATVERKLGELALAPAAVCLLNLEILDPVLAAAARFTARAGMERMVVNPAPARPLPAEVLHRRPVLTPNAGELEALIGDGHSVEGAARELSGSSGAPVVVTLGKEGAMLVSATECRRFPAPQSPAVDTTGAGDAFNGALAAALAQGYELPVAIERAVLAGSCSVTERGARGGLPTREEIDLRLSSAADGNTVPYGRGA
ncbi:MAG: ribokinase [Solirubrobacteraceae bacterium]